MKSANEIAELADRLLRDANAISIPVDVEFIARNCGVLLHEEALEDEISGMLVVKEDTKHIIYNAGHHENRQRFSIAHELGHLYLHHDDGDQLFVDTKMAVYHRAGAPGAAVYADKASITSPEDEREANHFASCLLMPADLLRSSIESCHPGVDAIDEFDVSFLAMSFKVSEQAMLIRLQKLGWKTDFN